MLRMLAGVILGPVAHPSPGALAGKILGIVGPGLLEKLHNELWLANFLMCLLSI
jgi:hypothetical protein